MKRLPLFLVILALLCLLPATAWTQEPAPKQDPLVPGALPPLVLPPMPGDVDEGDEDMPAEPGDTVPGEAVPAEPTEPAEGPIAKPPAPLPMPTGPAVVKSDLPVGVPYFFALEYDGKLVGYSRFVVERLMALGGRSSYMLNSDTRVKIGVGSVQDLKFTSRLEVDKKTLSPNSFDCTQKSEEGALKVTCFYSPSMVAQRNSVGKMEQTHFHHYDGEVPRLVFNNLWGHLDTFAEHYWLLVRSAAKGGVVKAYDPILRGGGDVIVYAPIQESWEWEGKKVPTLVYPITDLKGTLLARVRVLSKNMELLEIREVGTGLVFRRTTPDVAKKVDKVAGMDLWPRKVRASNVFFPDPEKLTTLEVEIDLQLRGGQFADHQIPGYRQYFQGDLGEGYMKGTVTVRSVPLEVSRKTPFPLKGEMPDDIKVYLKPGPGVESDFTPLATKGMELTWKSENAFQAARRLNNFVASQVENGVSLPSARYALESGVGNPESKALLLVALARAAGLPARRVGGLLFKDGDFLPHHWVEIWLGAKEGWTPFDPTTAEAGHVGASHIALWESGDIQSMTIAVKNYSPRAAKKVAFFNTELTWPVGEERTYAIMRDGEKVGTEMARIKELEFLDEQEVYRFEAESTLTDPAGDVKMTSSLLVEPSGLPVRFHLTQNGAGAPVETDLSFKGDVVNHESNGKKREVPYARGTYLTDQRFLSQWALVVGQTPMPKPGEDLKVGEKFTMHVFVPEDLRSREMVLEVKEREALTLADGTEIQARRLETEKGMIFYLNDKNQVVKIAIPNQKLEVVLEKTEFRMQ